MSDHTAECIKPTQDSTDALNNENLLNLKNFKNGDQMEVPATVSTNKRLKEPLKLVYTDEKMSKEIIIRKNPKTSSPRFCRPI